MNTAKDPRWYSLIIPLLLAWLMIVFLANRVGELSRRLERLETQKVERGNQ